MRSFFQMMTVRGVMPMHKSFNQEHETDYGAVLQEVAKQSRIIVLCASTEAVREIMIKAHELNFDNGEYVFFNIDLFSSDNATSMPWYNASDTPERNEKAKKAYEALMTVTLRKPTSPEYRKFSREVKARASTMYKNFTYGEQEVNSFVGAFHDAVILYALALNETIEAGGSVTDGHEITKRMWNRTFQGITGTVSIDENGDRNADYSLLDMNPETHKFEVVADYFGNKREYTPVPGKSIHWAGGRLTAPPDTPTCGFDGSKCPPDKPFPEYGIVIIVLGSILLVVLVIALIAYRHFKLEAELADMNWRVRWDDIMFSGPTRGKKPSERQNGHRNSYHSDCSADTIAVHLSDVNNRQLFTKTGYYKGAILAIKPIPRTHISIQKPLLLEIKKMKDLQNDHLVRFHGVCIDIPNQCILTEYCPKGSLQDVLENDQIKLDWMFRYSIMQDIVRGMTYLHSTDVKSHGHLKSSNCVVDSRFVVKITDFGLHYFREKEEELEEDTYAIERSRLWTAPELLRMSSPPAAGTQKGDVYSFAIICQEIVYRYGVFYLQNLEVSPKEITDKLKTGMKPYFRPTLEEFDCPNDELAGVIRRCWSEEAADRPDFQSLRTIIKKMNKDGDKGDILDNLLSRMEQYANNLEALVEERTSDYLQEKKKAEELLYNMLPKYVASQLIRGETISAEWYDGVTIYFSDICGFTALSAESTPMQVVDLLNDLYTCFDSIVEHFDVYKVETIGDAYMVVSGLPVRNGNLHAREIARMSLALLDAVFKFKIRHRPGDQLKLRIGIHSGPVCAGVVGLKMPRYCLFGDTVNTSSRMESNGLPLRIHVSPDTATILQQFDTFHLEMRGAVEMKGKGAITTFWLLGEDNSPYNIRQQGCNEPADKCLSVGKSASSKH
ncbi:atrial natriuretic peptide receptor 1 [Aplysia californica]|uniref:Guanylate cyclase n=1 Tax=Aplysia californica TaxID=6500 RepID=A0ABM1W3X2_APLCA|nr:atrial natriuretic peptide receptor 1 [Aplysia californica]